MKRSEVYLRAAEKCDVSSRASCLAICDVMKVRGYPEAAKAYGETMLPQDFDAGGSLEGYDRLYGSELQSVRVLLLLFAHHIAADEERK